MSGVALLVGLAASLLVAARQLRAAHRRSLTTLSPRGRKRIVLLLVAMLLGIQTVFALPAMADECGEAPVPERPGSGMVGAIDPPAIDHGDPGSDYGKYSYAGTVWHVYDDNCVLSKTLTDPNAVIDTWAGNELFDIGKNIVGATNSLHYSMLSQDSMLKPLDGAVENAAKTFYDNVYVRWFTPIALILAILVFRNIWHGDLASISRRGMWALAGMWLAASVLVMGPVYGEVDALLLQKTSQIQAGFIPSDQVDAQRDALPDMLYDNVILRTWQRGEFGDPTSPQAKQFTDELLSDQAWTKMDVGSADDQTKVTAKQDDFKTLPGKLGSATGYFEGSEGSRTGDGFLALLEALAFASFQLFAKASVLLAQVLVRVLLLAAPLIGLAAMIVQEVLPRVAQAAGAVLFNVLLLSALAGMHALLLNLIFGASDQLSLLAQILLAGLITVVFFVVGKPGRRMWQMVELALAAGNRGTASSGLFSVFRRRQGQPETPQEVFWDTVRTGETAKSSGESRGARVRPEVHYPESDYPQPVGAPVAATAQRMDRPAGRPALPSGVSYGPATVPGAPAALTGPASAIPESGPRRLVSRPMVIDAPSDSGEDNLVVPSRVGGAVDPAPRPRRAETEMVAGRPVFVLYRPSSGFEVRDGGWDSRAARG